MSHGASTDGLKTRLGGVDDLPAINSVVEAALSTWKLPDRVKRLSLPSYLYQSFDLEHMWVYLACKGAAVVGVGALEAANPADCPSGARGILLHGLYVHPAHMRQCVGSCLLHVARDKAAAEGADGVLIKAQTEAEGFFVAHGLEVLPVGDRGRHYARRYWMPV